MGENRRPIPAEIGNIAEKGIEKRDREREREKKEKNIPCSGIK